MASKDPEVKIYVGIDGGTTTGIGAVNWNGNIIFAEQGDSLEVASSLATLVRCIPFSRIAGLAVEGSFSPAGLRTGTSMSAFHGGVATGVLRSRCEETPLPVFIDPGSWRKLAGMASSSPDPGGELVKDGSRVKMVKRKAKDFEREAVWMAAALLPDRKVLQKHNHLAEGLMIAWLLWRQDRGLSTDFYASAR